MERNYESGPFARRMRGSVREITLAIVLTLAAVVFVLSALWASRPETTAVVAPGGTTKSEQN
jgi:hypothetical protein